MGIGHVLTGSPIPVAAQWVIAVLLFGGALAAVTLRSRTQRRIAGSVAFIALGGTIITWVVGAFQPGAAPYALRIIAPPQDASVVSPVTITVCGVHPDGTEVPATDSQHYMIVFIDGREVATVDRSQLSEAVPSGTHTITAELVTPSHHAFDPPQIAAVTLTVHPMAAGSQSLSPVSC